MKLFECLLNVDFYQKCFVLFSGVLITDFRRFYLPICVNYINVKGFLVDDSDLFRMFELPISGGFNYRFLPIVTRANV